MTDINPIAANLIRRTAAYVPDVKVDDSEAPSTEKPWQTWLDAALGFRNHWYPVEASRNIREGDHKLIKFWGGPFELYDLKEDLGEAKNLAAAMPKRVSELDTLLLKRLRETGAKLPRKNPDFARK